MSCIVLKSTGNSQARLASLGYKAYIWQDTEFHDVKCYEAGYCI